MTLDATMTLRLWFTFLFFCIPWTFALAATQAELEGLVKWVQSKGGFFNSKQEIRHEDPTDPTSLLGVFAKERIDKDEILARIPWDIIIDSGGQAISDDTVMNCNTIRNLVQQMKLGEKSMYWPFVSYLMSQRVGQIPSAWSEEGKDLLEEMIGKTSDVLPPEFATDWLDNDWYKVCHGDRNDPLAANAAMLVIQRADDDILVPLFDIYNHRNGRFLNTENEVNTGKDYTITASRVIEAGEQIYMSYNMCSTCNGRENRYGTGGEFLFLDLKSFRIDLGICYI